MDNYKKTPTVFQMEATECGAASLAMIFAFYGKHFPLEKMRIETGVSRDGCNAANMMRAAKKYGLDCHGYRKEPESLVEMKMPCIIHWNFNHFVVLEGFKGDSVYLNDPAIGRRKLSFREFDECFTGIVLTFEPTERFSKEKDSYNFKEFLKQRLDGSEKILFQLFYMGLLLVFPGIVLPILSQVFIDDILVGGFWSWTTRLLVCMSGIVLFKALLTYYRGIVLQRFRSKLTLLSGYNFLHHLLRLPISFFDQRYAGELVERMESNTNVNRFLAGELAETALNVFIAIFYLIVLLIYSPTMTLLGIANVGICFAVIAYSNKLLAEKTMKLQLSGGKLYSIVCAGLSITDTIKASGAEAEYTSRVLGYQAKFANIEQDLSKFQLMVGAIPGALSRITDVLILMIGGILVIHGNISIGMLLAFNSLFDSFCEPVESLVGFIQRIQALKADLNRVEDINKYEEDIRFSATNDKKDIHGKCNGIVEMKGVSFGYSRLKPALIQNIDFKINSGESIAIVGASGCGKSTISKIASGLYMPWSGEILFDGKPIVEYPKEVINASVSTVSQNIVLFSGTIRENISMWNPAVLEEDIVEAAKDACIHDFVMQQREGYDYMLNEGATNLSGGQRQRIEIARALATKPSLLIMDEATSALDPITEKRIIDNIKRRGCSCIVVAHRLSAVRDCNQIIVMKHGEIIQRGTHRQLMNEDGYYVNFIQNV